MGQWSKEVASKFQTLQTFAATGVIGLDPYTVGAERRARVVVTGVGGGNVIKVQGRIKGATAYEDLATITGPETGLTVDISVYDQIRFNCTTYSASGTPTLVASGFFSEAAGGGSGAVDSVNGNTGTVILNTDDISEGATNKYVVPGMSFLAADGSAATPSYGFNDEPGTDLGMYRTGNSIGWTAQGVHAMQLDPGGDLTIVGNVAAANYPPTGSADTFAGFDGSGVLSSVPGFSVGSLDGVQASHTYAPAGGSGGQTLHSLNLNIEPTANSPDRQINSLSISSSLDNANSGFTFGTNGNASRLLNLSAANVGTGNTGEINFINQYFNVGNGTDPVSVKGFSYAYGFGNVNANATINGSMQGYGFQPSINASATLTSAASVTAFYDSANIACDMGTGYTSMNLSPTISSIPNNNNLTSININPGVTTFVGNAGFNGVSVGGTFSAFGATGGINAINVNPTTTGAHYANGIAVNMNSCGMYAGVQSSIVIQDLTLTFNAVGDNDTTTIEYVDDVTAGSETATYTAPNIVVHIESGVSTATQVKTALEANFTINSNLTITVSGTASNAQVTQAATNFTGGENAGTKLAADFTGDVNINGALAFTGGLSVGAISAYYSEALTDGGGTPDSSHSLITAPTVAANVTLANADYLGVNTAALIDIGANATVTTAFVGIAALGLPAVATIGAGATVDRIAGAVFALSLGGGTGTIDTVALCRSLAIGDGTTTVNRLYSYEAAMPFGAVGTDSWGLYASDNNYNWMKGSLRIGGTTITDDKPDTGFSFHVEGDSKLEGDLAHLTGNLGLFGATPIAQPTTGYASATLSAIGGANIQANDTFDGYTLQQVVAALRGLGALA